MGDKEVRKLTAKYELKEPASHGVYSFKSPAQEAQQIPRQKGIRSFAAMEEAAPHPEVPVKAVWVVHGIGQQMPFVTLDQLANGLMDACERNGHSRPTPSVREAKIGDMVTQRVELELPVKKQDGSTETIQVHLYEAYWAPITQGVVKLWDVVSFLWNGATRGLMNYLQHFERAMFREMVPFKLTWRTPLYNATALLVLMALIIINAITVASGAGKLFGATSNFAIPAAAFLPLSTIASVISVVAITFGAALFLASLAGASPIPPARAKLTEAGTSQRPGFWPAWIRNFTWVAFAGTVATIVLGAGYMAWTLAGFFYLPLLTYTLPGAMSSDVQAVLNACALVSIFLAVVAKIIQSRHRLSPSYAGERLLVLCGFFYLEILLFFLSFVGGIWLLIAPANPLARILDWKLLHSSIWIWPFLAIISAMVRGLMISYVGDVAAYISPNKLDTFNEVRKKIKDVAYQSASAVYLAQGPDGDSLLYSKVAVLGHSLGSVIAYDTLNSLISEDLLNEQKASIIQRTGILITFGSPLDKIAFFFTSMGKNIRHIREQLASVVQPLIQDYAYRPYPWINVFSRNDIVCGSLDFYDFPQDADPSMICAPDDDACKQNVIALKAQASQHCVQNIRDEEALTPLVAHVEYWTDRILWDKLYENLTT